MTRRRINQFDPSSGTAISSYGEEVAPPQRLGWSSSCYICVLIFIILLLHVRCLWRHDVQEDRPANASLLAAFRTLLCLFARFFAFMRSFAS
jgi:hypothetical protein